MIIQRSAETWFNSLGCIKVELSDHRVDMGQLCIVAPDAFVEQKISAGEMFQG